MAAFDWQLGEYNVTARLFNMISSLPSDKQFILYKQLVKGRVTAQLFKLIIDLSEEDKIQLLEKLSGMPYEEDAIQTVNLDETESFMRENPRKICLIPATCKIVDQSFKSYIIDISTVGAFIETNDRYPAGQKISMAFKLPNHPETFNLNGRISRSGSRGIGVKFYDLTKTQQDIIIRFIENTH